MKHCKVNFCTLLLFLSLANTISYAQIWVEPKLDLAKESRTPYDLGSRQGMGVDLILTDFGFALGTQYRFLLSAQREATISFSIGTLRDVSEQTFTSYYSEIIPNKFNRIISMPLMFGFKQRLLSNYIQDNFRVFFHSAVGTNFAFVYPYFGDMNGNGIRDSDYQNGNVDPVYDVLSGWDKGFFKIGPSAEFMINIDFGTDPKHFTTLRFGVVLHYFADGIQVMEPFKYKNVQIVNSPTVPNFAKQKLFISPQFNLIFGGLWK